MFMTCMQIIALMVLSMGVTAGIMVATGSRRSRIEAKLETVACLWFLFIVLFVIYQLRDFYLGEAQFAFGLAIVPFRGSKTADVNGKEVTMNSLQIAYIGYLRMTKNFPFTDNIEVSMRRRDDLILSVTSMSTWEILMNTTFVRDQIASKTRRAVRMSRVARFLRKNAAPWLCRNNAALAIFSRLGTPSFVKNHLEDLWAHYESECAEMWLSGRYMGYETKAEALPDIRKVLEMQYEVTKIMMRLHTQPAGNNNYVEDRMAALIEEIEEEAVKNANSQAPIIDDLITVETPVCCICGKTGTVVLTGRDYAVYKLDDRLIQDKLSNITDDEREQLISGTHPECWDRLFQ